MSDRFTCLPIEKLVQLIFEEEKTGSIFGIPNELFFTPKSTDPFRIRRYGVELETPIGVAAGPHTQLSQNIISAWLTGARFMELKTVQTLDQLELTKPCIDMSDEGYNCEWSQELSLMESYNEYLNAWIVLHILKHEFQPETSGSGGFSFNMSVGYNLEGILAPNVQRFLDKMSDCSLEKTEKIDRLAEFYPPIRDIDIPNCISDNLTVSTMHGCPPDEIEKIGRYFIEDRRLHTTIKLNPTLLGSERLRDILNKTFEYDIHVPEEAFDHDLKYPEGVDLIRSLKTAARRSGVSFGLKLTNTLEVLNPGDRLPAKERMIYMSGRPLHAISINVAAKLQQEFNGKLDLSFCAGVDCFNVADVLACNMQPVTVCTDILKPGGYTRLGQYLDEIAKRMSRYDAKSINQYIQSHSPVQGTVEQSGLATLLHYAEQVTTRRRYMKSAFPFDSIKTDRELTPFDCIKAPCIASCPTEQDVPAYISSTARGDYVEAQKIILDTNPFPNMQGLVCHHPCHSRCTRINIDNPLKIREIKRFVAERERASRPTPVAVIGAGPSGLSCAWFLARAGIKVTVYEAKSKAGGMASAAIPKFRLDDESLEVDIERIRAAGVDINFNVTVTTELFEHLHKEYDALYIGVGAQKSMKLNVPGEVARGVYDQLTFLKQAREGNYPEIGPKVVVIGGGNSAVDAARTARRLVGEKGEVSILYRRTKKQMPADPEEISEAEKEGVKIIERVAPENISMKEERAISITCCQMKPGDVDESGRPRPVRVENSTLHFEADTIIPAVGQLIKVDFLPDNVLSVDENNHCIGYENVFAGGDAVRGAATLIEAIADGRRAAENIINYMGHEQKPSVTPEQRDLSYPEYLGKLAHRRFGLTSSELYLEQLPDFSVSSRALTEKEAVREAERCLRCDLYCSICTTVCPNRANVAYFTGPRQIPLQRIDGTGDQISIRIEGSQTIRQPVQVLNIVDFCNECGNCTTFCPAEGAPYIQKPRFCISQESFNEESNAYYLKEGTLLRKNEETVSSVKMENRMLAYDSEEVSATINPETLMIEQAELRQPAMESVDMGEAVMMAFLLLSLKEHQLFR